MQFLALTQSEVKIPISGLYGVLDLVLIRY